ncbi:hypothetical protein CFP56_006052 [Quercus suber]|uniref:TOD1/MUCI70 glycosyltransferase-like domain-containing protein n=1 Tax=Quercus suber TaxID=58331 RepID=A0AAW0L8Z8_QUESU
MGLSRYTSEFLPERRGGGGGSGGGGGGGPRRGRRFGGRITKQRLSRWVFALALIFIVYLVVSCVRMFFFVILIYAHILIMMQTMSSGINSVISAYILSFSANASLFPLFDLILVTFLPFIHHSVFPCEVAFAKSVDDLVEPKDLMNFTQFLLEYVYREEIYQNHSFEPRFGGLQTLAEREKSFYARNQTLHCGFVKGPPGYPSTGFDIDEMDKAYMYTCKVVVSSCIFGSSDFLRRPTRNLISEYSQKNVCFVMFVDEQTFKELSSEGNTPTDRGFVGLWRIVIVRNLPYEDMRKTGKVLNLA